MLLQSYLMEGDEEAVRLDLKTNGNDVENQARWAGLRPGMRVADLGCGSGKTTHHLCNIVQPNGKVVGIDFSQQRIDYAKNHYDTSNIRFECRDIRDPLDDLGKFDFIWIRFVLEYYRNGSFSIAEKALKILKDGGILCLIDLDYNCLSHFGIPERLENTIRALIKTAEIKANFDPYVGRKLYSYLYDLGCRDICVNLSHHHLIFGELNSIDHFNWSKKIEAAGTKSDYSFNEYKNGYEGFAEEFKSAFADHRRFTYTPIICARGCKPSE